MGLFDVWFISWGFGIYWILMSFVLYVVGLEMLGLHCLFSVVLVVGLVCGFGCVVGLIVYLCGWLSCLRDVVLVIDRCVTFRADCFVVVLWVF